MHFVTVEDLEAAVEVIIFPSLAQKTKDILAEDRVLRVRGRIDHKEDEVKLIGHEIEVIDTSRAPRAKILHLEIPRKVTERLLRNVGRVLAKYPGQCPVVVNVGDNGSSQLMRLGQGYSVNPNNDLMAELLEILPQGSARLSQARGGEARIS